jgi:hypothetical protein
MRSEASGLMPMTGLVSLAFGPQFVVGEEFGDLGAVAVGIYGSWAARRAGVTGPAPDDVDVMVVGDVPRREMYEAAERAEQRLGLPVNPVLRSQERWVADATRWSSRFGHPLLSGSPGRSRRKKSTADGAGAMKRQQFDRLLAAGHVERVQGAQADGASWLDRARRGPGPRIIAETAPDGSVVLAYDAARQACVALLAQQGLRRTTVGGHYVIEEIIRAYEQSHAAELRRSCR